MSYEWMGDALCARVDPDLFHPEPGMGNLSKQAKRVCRACAVTSECLTLALANPALHGVMGGTTERERNRIRQGARRDLA